MRYRKLRIAFSAACGVAFVLFAVLWVRSYWWRDSLDWSSASSRQVYLNSTRGLFSFATSPPGNPRNKGGFYYSKVKATDRSVRKQWEFIRSNGQRGVRFPYWFPALLFGSLATFPWTRRPKFRFSLRNLLIAMTLIALLLYLILDAAR